MTSNKPNSPREPSKSIPIKVPTMPTIYEGVVWNNSQEDRVKGIKDRKMKRCKISTSTNISKKNDNK